MDVLKVKSSDLKHLNTQFGLDCSLLDAALLAHALLSIGKLRLEGNNDLFLGWSRDIIEKGVPSSVATRVNETLTAVLDERSRISYEIDINPHAYTMRLDTMMDLQQFFADLGEAVPVLIEEITAERNDRTTIRLSYLLFVKRSFDNAANQLNSLIEQGLEDNLEMLKNMAEAHGATKQ